MFHKEYAEVFEGTPEWKSINVDRVDTYGWQSDSTYIRLSPFFEGMQATPAPVNDIHGARILAMLGDSVTTDHISPLAALRRTARQDAICRATALSAGILTPMVHDVEIMK